ncbi:MAG: D-alanyl-D-alanine carboxypeptidase/D-alanyl-D-alanine-endopeptidase [Acidimicrobiia bacterium]|nr:D-alanyl-D-alanine carboxypeptidase/D-alanyl-D-alanine-endopeptidase [Acidimicrobiia bacterium]MBT8217154.1 D-alanyl-D-alanine carboxypeptidase/D-alanyl-D-alanine-endopeptidase [Acidimicrobiia bacterium]NNF11164.1 D-alanyl-D-alanine carboxypeptidase/D-alanyl-D-alanine-endopeptidase [Acidimicrobiia bacterium]NNL69332.1 D-alanyl-D-alanine carboxypeptidase/D-alanyl-D-alanine-endopeptidase [Acidimicrobiia bacterium]
MRRMLLLVLLTGAWVVVGLSPGSSHSDPITPDPIAPVGASFIAFTPVGTTTSTTVAPYHAVPDPAVPARVAGAPPDPYPVLVRTLERAMLDPRLDGLESGVSVWVEGDGVVFEHNPGLELYPASNQKLLTGAGALGLLPADFRFRTEIVQAGDDLVLVAGGDPTLTTADLDELAAQVKAAGITAVPGRLIVDATRYSAHRTAPGWQDWQMPTYVGPLSVFVVGDNRHRTDEEYLADPDLGNAALLRAALSEIGVRIAGATELGEAPADTVTVAVRESPDRDALVRRLLTSSDNEIAEALVREIGFRVNGIGTSLGGALAIERYLEGLGWAETGQAGDGSGLSRANLRGAAEWRELMVLAMEQEWWPTFVDSLAVAGRTGTLRARLGGAATAGIVRAKTGSIIGGRSLTGILTDAAGRTVVFSFVVNGSSAGAALPVVDEFVETLARHW